MLKGHVFSKQIFGNPIFALFINTFLDGKNGVSNNYKNGMKVTYSGSNLTISSGAVCIQGRFLEEDTSTTISAGTTSSYCKLVIEIDLDKENTESNFAQATYKIVRSSSGYPNLTQSNIVKNVSGIYQYELARFRTSSSGISNFQDMRTFLDFDSIYDAIESEYTSILEQLEEELANAENGSLYWLKASQLTNQNLNDYKTEGFYYAAGGNTVSNKPDEVDSFGVMIKRTATGYYKQILDNHINRWTRYFNGSSWADWVKEVNKNDFAILEGNISLSNGTGSVTIDYPAGFSYNNCVVIALGFDIYGNDAYDYISETSSPLLFEARLTSSGIIIKSNSLEGVGTTSTKKYKLVLMKI